MGATHLGQRQARFLLQKSGMEEPGPSSLRVRPAWPLNQETEADHPPKGNSLFLPILHSVEKPAGLHQPVILSHCASLSCLPLPSVTQSLGEPTVSQSVSRELMLLPPLMIH